MTLCAYDPDVVLRGYAWLGHDRGVTEVVALHPQYRADDPGWNTAHRCWTITTYLRNPYSLRSFVRMHAGERMVCYGINPRDEILRHSHGFPRSAKEHDITVGQNLLIDLDARQPDEQRLQRVLRRADQYVTTIGLNAPVRSYTGRGAHLLFAYGPLSVKEYPDLKQRLTTFKERLAQALRYDLQRNGITIDSTQDLRRMVRVYGTAKPSIGIKSTFPITTREPDKQLTEYLTQLPVTTITTTSKDPIMIAPALPPWFPELLKNDHHLRDLWNGQGKPAGTDTTNSGYDYTIAKILTKHTNNPSEIATIINQRPKGRTARERKGTTYLERTINNAMRSR